MGKAKDLTNYISGDLTVIERDYNYPKTLKSKNPSSYWKCKCKCGKIISVKSNRLTTDNPREKATSCKECAFKNKRIDLTGQRFGKWTVLENTNNKKGGHFLWKCKCDCGTIKLVDGQHLKSGTTKSCGCLCTELFRDNLIGQRFGKLTVIEKATQPDTVKSKGHAYWLCKCDCGNKTIVRASSLKDKTITGCGCQSSLGEQKIIQLLNQNNIIYETQKTFNTCRSLYTNCLLRFDFYINNEFLLEFDGEQHYKYKDTNWDTKEHYEQTKLRDKYKNNWCKQNNIVLKRIPYWKRNTLTIEDIMGDKYIYLEE